MIKILNKKEIKDFVNKTPQYYDLSPKEVKARIGITSSKIPIASIQKFYIDNVFSEPSKYEMDNLIPYLIKADDIALEIVKELGIKENLPWVISKINKGYDWNFPQTRANVVFLPEWFFETPKVSTLVHEKLHLYQREYPEIFNNLYKKWGFHKVKLTSSQINTLKKHKIDNSHINNPDTTDGGMWAYQTDDNTLLLPFYVIDSNHKPTTIGFLLSLKDMKKPMKFVGNISEYSNFFGVKQIDHPNEIYACIKTKDIED